MKNIILVACFKIWFSILIKCGIGVRPHKEKINISKEIINKTKGAVASYAAQIFTHLSVVSSRQRSYDWLRCEGKSRG